MKQVITISPSGGLSGLQRREPNAIDLRKFGNAEIQRISDIKWLTVPQRWHIHVLGGFFGRTLTKSLYMKVMEVEWTGEVLGEVLVFKEYEDAVKTEVEFLDRARARGLL